MTGYGFEIVFMFYRLGFQSPHLDKPGPDQGFKGYNQWKRLTLWIKIRNTQLIPVAETPLLTRQRQNTLDMSK
jgi:hypothetical protein